MDRFSRCAVRLTAVVAASALLLSLPAQAALAHGGRDRLDLMRQTHAPDEALAVNTSSNVQHVYHHPGSVGISGCFMRSKPLFVTSGLEAVRVYDASNPAQPDELGSLPSAHFENEAMSCGERWIKKRHVRMRFVLIGVDLYQASPDDPQHTNTGGNELVLVDVSDPFHPTIRSRTPATTSTHTVACVVQTDCRYAYSAGDDGSDSFSIFDLRNLNRPREVDARPGRPGVQPFSSPTAGHKWNFDTAGYGTHTGFDGSSIFDVSRPRHPKLVTSTGLAGRGDDPDFPGYNDFIHHNSLRPNARAFKPGSTASVRHGNVLFVTEEDYEQTDCSKAGSFQSWKVKRLNGRRNQIVPLDKVELADLSDLAPPQYAFCSAHWFDYHQKGIAAVAFYGGGLQLVDVRDPRHLKPFGHAFWGSSEVWDAYWVPEYDTFGNITKRRTSLVYTVDLVRGLDVYNVDLPGSERLGDPVRLGAGNPFTTLSWPRDGLTVLALLAALVGSLALRRRARP